MRLVSPPTTPEPTIQRKRTLDHSALNTPSNRPPSGRPTRKRSVQTSHATSGVIFEKLYTPAHMENVELQRKRGTYGRVDGHTLDGHTLRDSSPKLSPSSPCPTSASSLPPPPFFQLSPHQPTDHNSSLDKIQRDLEEIVAFIKIKGFTSISHVHQTMHKYPYNGSSVLQQEQRDDWMDGMPELLRIIQMSTKRQEPYVREAFHHSILKYATDLLKVELDAFLLHKDNRTQTCKVRSKAPSTPAFLRMAAADITPKFLDSNVLGECEKVFSGFHDDWKGIPLLWELTTKLVAHPDRHNMVVMALSILCHAKNENMRRVQSMVGMMLHHAGVPQRVVTQLNQLGISIGCTAINKAVTFLSDAQRRRLLDVGSNIQKVPYIWVYDNIQVEDRVGSERVDSKKRRYDATGGYMAKAIVDPGQVLPTKQSFHPEKMDGMTSSHLFPATAEDRAFFENVQKHQILIALDEAFFAIVKTPPKKPARTKSSSTTGSGTQTLDVSIPGSPCNTIVPPALRASKFTIVREWPGIDRTLTPETLPCLPLQTMPFNEGSTSGTISWAEDVGTRQLSLKDCQLGEHMVIAYGDLLTVQNLRSAKCRRNEDSEGIASLNWVYPFFGFFHLRMAILNMLYVNWRAPGCPDFAHLNEIIITLTRSGFNNHTKMAHFRDTEDLMLIIYISYIAAWVIERFRPNNPSWTSQNPTERRDWTSTYLRKMMLEHEKDEWLQTHVIGPLFEDMFSPATRARAIKENTRTPFHQVTELLAVMGLYRDLRDSIKYGRVGKFVPLLRSLLPYFAGSSSHKYTKEISTFLTLEKICEPQTWNYITDNLLIKAKTYGFIEVDCRMEHMVRDQKEFMKTSGHNFEMMSSSCSLVTAILDEGRRALKATTSKDNSEVIRERKRKKIDTDVLSLTSHIITSGIIHDSDSLVSEPIVELYKNGIINLQDYDMKKVRDGFFGEDYSCLGMVTNDIGDGIAEQATGDESEDTNLRDVDCAGAVSEDDLDDFDDTEDPIDHSLVDRRVYALSQSQ